MKKTNVEGVYTYKNKTIDLTTSGDKVWQIAVDFSNQL